MPAPLDLTAEIDTPDGTRYRFGANEPPEFRMRNLSFRTKIGEGFSDASVTLSRRIDKDYPDLNLLNGITISGADGTVVYEGRLEAMPRELGESHSISLTFAGWIANMKGRKFTEVYVDRDLKAWQPPTAKRRATLLGAGYAPVDPSQIDDPTDSQAVIQTGWEGQWSTYVRVSEAWYDAGPGQTISQITYSWKRETTQINPADISWAWQVWVGTNDAAQNESGTNLRAAGPGTNIVFNPSGRYRWASLQVAYSVTPAGADAIPYHIQWSKIAVYGNHGVPLRTGDPSEPQGVTASDVLKNIVRRWCPLLNDAGIQSSDYVIQHLAFRGRTFPYDAALELNKFHLWHLGVWENKTVHFRPYDLMDYDWEIRTDDPGTTFAPQGPSTDTLFNGIAVTYTDLLTGQVNMLTPETNPELGDTDPDNPYNKRGVQQWDELELSAPTLQAQAIQIGRAVLADRNRPRTPGTITVQGYIRDRAGNEQPVWKVRAGDKIAITDFPNDTPRLIVETDYNDDDKSVSIAVDLPFQLLDAYLDRLGNALGARGLA